MQPWEYAVLDVEWAWLGQDEGYEFTAIAWVDDREIYRKVRTDMYWSVPLADMGRMGWELVGTNAQNVVVQSWVKGYGGSIAVPVKTAFFFKRPSRESR